MPKIEANLDAGLNTQDDPKRVGFNGFTELQNVRHANGKLIKRYGTGTQSSAISGTSSAKINNAVGFSHRKMTGVVITNISLTTITFSGFNTITISNSSYLKIPTGGVDLRTVFKPGDTIVLSTASVASDGSAVVNKGRPLIVEAVPSALSITIKSGFISTNEVVNNNGSAGTAKISFARQHDADEAKSLTLTDENSVDGECLIVTYIDGNFVYAGILNDNNYGDLLQLYPAIQYSTSLEESHVRMKVYTDAVRFSCGLDVAPKIFKYVNRFHFNGLLTTQTNSHGEMLYPRFTFEDAVPQISAGTYDLTDFKVQDIISADDNIKYIRGSLNLKDNTYRYKFVPVYDGNQEGLLSDAIVEANTAEIAVLIDSKNKRSVLSPEKSCALITTSIDLTKLNIRTSGINVYRSTNNGTYYKIKSIYMGDNDPNQHDLTNIYNELNRVWFSGSSTLSTGTLDGKNLVHDSHTAPIMSSSGVDNFQTTGYKSFQVNHDTLFDDISEANYSKAEYGDNKTCKFNHFSEETETIVGGDDSYTGGSPNGGWYIGGTEKALTVDGGGSNNLSVNDEPGSGTDGDIHDNCAGYNLNNPFGDAASGYMDFFISNPGDIKNDSGACFDINEEDAGNLTHGTYIISGWIRAVGLNHRDSRWNFYVTTNKDQETNADSGGSGLKSIAVGRGTENANMPWTYFQYQIDIPSGSDLFGVVFINTPDGLTSSASDAGAGMSVQVWGLRLTETVSNYTLTDNLRGFFGNNVMVSNQISSLQKPVGTLKGNRIINDDVSVPCDIDADRTYIKDNFGPFIQTVDEVPGISNTDNNKDDFMFGSSNYQFYFAGTSVLEQNVKLDFFDPGLPDGARHPNETATSTDVKFKYATMLNGRQFVANVKITGDEETEEYPNFVMYSESGSPDIIPTSNFIQLQDLQGGEIVGIETLMSDIVVFMTKGIFRINVPSGDPTSWSLVEAHPNIGCINDKGITKVPNGIFFLSNEDVIYLDSGFQATPITYPIRDDYQSTVASSSSIMKTHYDAKYNKLYITKSVSTNTEFYIYDIFRQTWSTEKHEAVEYDEFVLDNNNNTLLIESASNGSNGSGNNSYISKAVDTTEYFDDNGSGAPEEIDMIVKTGEQELTSYDENAYIRRVNTNTEKFNGSKLDLEVIAGTTVTKANHLDGAQSTRTSQRAQKVQVKISDDSIGSAGSEGPFLNPPIFKEISKIEVEYE